MRSVGEEVEITVLLCVQECYMNEQGIVCDPLNIVE